MLVFQSVLLASLSVVHAAPSAHHPVRIAPIWAAALPAVQAPWRRLQLAPSCGQLDSRTAQPCFSLRSGHGISDVVPAAGSYADPEVRLPRKNDSFRTIGGFVHLDLVASPHLRGGPEFSWSTPDSPREDLQKMRLLAPGWGLRYVWDDAPLAVGVSAGSRFVMVGKELPIVDPLTSEARIEFRLP